MARPASQRALLLALEWPRAFAEAATLAGAWPLLGAMPSGDGHPVLVLPGYLAGDGSTRLLRAALRRLGYRAYGWRLGVNFGLADGVEGRLLMRLDAIHARRGRSVSLIGWSLGGVYARELAKLAPERVRQVVTLGSPFRMNGRDGQEEWLRSVVHGERPRRANGRIADPPPVPATAIVSRSDGIAGFRRCLEKPGARAENIEVPGSHIGLGMNPLVLYAIADRLAQPEGAWKSFDRSGLRGVLYG
jgi:pimeloyl-ACP methyl ester carboxylesterase